MWATLFIVIFVIVVILVVIDRVMTKEIRLRYDANEVNRFRLNMEPNSTNITDQSVTQEFTTYPLYKQSGELVGTVCTDARLISGGDVTDVLYRITYKFGDSNSTIQTTLFYPEHDVNESVLTKDEVFDMTIQGGTGKYRNATGTIRLHVFADGRRDLVIRVKPRFL
jgi:hypothetical protein